MVQILPDIYNNNFWTKNLSDMEGSNFFFIEKVHCLNELCCSPNMNCVQSYFKSAFPPTFPSMCLSTEFTSLCFCPPVSSLTHRIFPRPSLLNVKQHTLVKNEPIYVAMHYSESTSVKAYGVGQPLRD